MLINGFKNVSFIIFNSKFFQEINIFFCKCSFLMMFFLGFNIVAHIGNLAFAVWKGTKSFLSWEFPFDEMIGIYPSWRITFHLLHEMRQWFRWTEAKQDMHMVANTTYGKHLVTIVLNNWNDILVKSVSPAFINQTEPVLNSKNGMYVYLCVCVRHLFFLWRIPMGCKLLLCFVFTERRIPTGCFVCPRRFLLFLPRDASYMHW